MPNRFSLTRKSGMDALGTGGAVVASEASSGPVSLQQIDSEMCQAFGIVPDPDKYYHQWVDTIGLALASGQSFDTIIKDCTEAVGEQSTIANPEGIAYWNTKLRIAEYLNERFVSDAWAGGRGMETIGELPTTDELEELSQRLLDKIDDDHAASPQDGNVVGSNDLMMALGAIWECVALRNAMEHVIKTCTDMKTVAYLRDLREKTKH